MFCLCNMVLLLPWLCWHTFFLILLSLCLCVCAGVRNSHMTRIFPPQVSSLCSPTRHGALSYEQCTAFWMVHLHTWSRRLFWWMTAVTEVVNPNLMLFSFSQMTVNIPIYDSFVWFQTELTSYLSVFCEKLIIAQFLKKVSAFYFTQKLITVFTAVWHWTQFWTR
jgi:hypothetical protein